MRGMAGSRSLLEVVAKALSVDSHCTRMVDEAIAKALSVNRTLLDEAHLPLPRTYAAERRRFVTVQLDGAVPMGLGVMHTQCTH